MNMNFLVWNCRGAGGCHFHNLIRDYYIGIYRLDFVAILEPHISGDSANKVIDDIGFSKSVRVEARGFSGGIWCLWKSQCPPIRVISSSFFCIHLIINENSISPWYLSIVYASPSISTREQVWQELREFNDSINGPWALPVDSNAITSERERLSGAPPIHSSLSAFNSCIQDCALMDLGFLGPPFTFSHGSLSECLDRVMCNDHWLSLFLSNTVTHLAFSSSDHCGVWLRLDPINDTRQGSFKFWGSWVDHPDLVNQIKNSWVHSFTWNQNIDRVSSNLKVWNRETFGNFLK